jgi:putative MFS transporter
VNDELTVAARLDRLNITKIHRTAVVVIGVGMFFDLYEVFLAGTVSTALTKDFHVDGAALKPLLASAFVGAFIGAVVMSRLADRLGRRRAFYLTLSIYSVFSVIAAFSVNVEMLIICRFLAGLGIGGELPLCDAYLSDLLPARSRGRLIGWAYTVGFCGVPVAGFLALSLVTHTYGGVSGWRLMFLIGGVGAAICWFLRRGLPESPRWLEAVGRHAEADAVVRELEELAGQQLNDRERRLAANSRPALSQEPAPIRLLVAAPWRKKTLMLVIFQILQVFGYYGFGTLVPIVLSAKGYDIVHSLTFSALSFLGYPIGSLLSVPVLERVERKALIMISALGMLVFGLGFGYSASAAGVIAFGFCYTLASNLFSNAYHVFQSELYPTKLRATGAGTAYSLSRLASAVMPFVLLPVLDTYGATAVFVVIAIAMAGVILDVGLLGPRTTGRALAEVSGERLPAAAPALSAGAAGASVHIAASPGGDAEESDRR